MRLFVVGVMHKPDEGFTQLTLAPGLSNIACENFVAERVLVVAHDKGIKVRDIVDEDHLFPADPTSEARVLSPWKGLRRHYHPELEGM